MQKDTKPKHAMTIEQQRRRVLALLARGPKHTHALRAEGISHPSARVMELRRTGYRIDTWRVVTVDSDGWRHKNVALYELIRDPRAPSTGTRNG